MTLVWVILATLIVSLLSFIGVFFLFVKRETLNKLIYTLISVAAGMMIGGAFLHLLPHSLEHISPFLASWIFVIGFISFFLVERVLRWRHCHEWECAIHPVSYLNLIGDGLHNFIDGVVIAASFMVDFQFGVITTLVVIAHEAPQEIGDYIILVYGGMERKKALFFNFASALTAIAGGIIGYFFLKSTKYIYYVMPFAAGNFFYISASDLIPELHKEVDFKKSFNSFILLISGIIMMSLLKFLFKEIG